MLIAISHLAVNHCQVCRQVLRSDVQVIVCHGQEQYITAEYELGDTL